LRRSAIGVDMLNISYNYSVLDGLKETIEAVNTKYAGVFENIIPFPMKKAV